MIEISIHLPSLLIGFFLGYAVIAGIFTAISLDKRWSDGWFAGAEARNMIENLGGLIKQIKKEGEADE